MSKREMLIVAGAFAAGVFLGPMVRSTLDRLMSRAAPAAGSSQGAA